MPWSAIAVTSTGDIKPCCAYTETLGKYKNPEDLEEFYYGDQFDKIRSDMNNNIIPSGCQGCYNDKLTNKRIKFDERLQKENIEVSTDTIEKPKFIELAVSNNCNLDCVMCSSEFSSKWLTKDKEFNRQVFNQFRLDSDHLPKLIDITKDCEIGIELIGGEPLYDKFSLSYLELISDINPDLPITITTNLTILTDKTVNILKKLNNLILNISIDGTNEIFFFIRGEKYYKVIKNLDIVYKEIKPKSIIISPCISIYNALNIADLVNELKDIGTFRFNNMVRYPEYLGVEVLPKDIRLEVINRLQKLELKTNIEKNQLNDLVNYLGKDFNVSLGQSIDWTKKMNSIRNLEIWELEPLLEFLK